MFKVTRHVPDVKEDSGFQDTSYHHTAMSSIGSPTSNAVDSPNGNGWASPGKGSGDEDVDRSRRVRSSTVLSTDHTSMSDKSHWISSSPAPITRDLLKLPFGAPKPWHPRSPCLASPKGPWANDYMKGEDAIPDEKIYGSDNGVYARDQSAEEDGFMSCETLNDALGRPSCEPAVGQCAGPPLSVEPVEYTDMPPLMPLVCPVSSPVTQHSSFFTSTTLKR